ncbi:hypothetical protein GCM10028820_03710 [Tessaracoccus terricola]
MIREKSWLRVVAVPLVALFALLVGCAGVGGGGAEDLQAPQQGEAHPQDGGQQYPAEDGDTGEADERMVIRTKTIRLEVPSTEEAVGQIRELTRAASGTVSDMQVATDDGWVYREDSSGDAMRGWVTVRVPSEGYEDFLDAVMELGNVQYQSEASEDVTQQHVDMSARLENLRAQEARLRDFFEAAQNVEEMLAIEQELGRVRGEIESLDAQITHLERQAAMATVTLELTEPHPVVAPQGPSWGFVEAIGDGFRGAAALLTGALTVVIAASPLWVAALVLFFPIRALVRRRRARADASGAGPKQSILATVPAPSRPAAAPSRPAAAPGKPASSAAASPSAPASGPSPSGEA